MSEGCQGSPKERPQGAPPAPWRLLAGLSAASQDMRHLGRRCPEQGKVGEGLEQRSPPLFLHPRDPPPELGACPSIPSRRKTRSRLKSVLGALLPEQTPCVLRARGVSVCRPVS